MKVSLLLDDDLTVSSLPRARNAGRVLPRTGLLHPVGLSVMKRDFKPPKTSLRAGTCSLAHEAAHLLESSTLIRTAKLNLYMQGPVLIISVWKVSSTGAWMAGVVQGSFLP